MNDTELPAFDRGAEWVRADFHLHTIKDLGQSRGFRAEFVGRENDFPKEWIAKLKSEEIRVAVVTNHNGFDRDEYKCLHKLGAKEGILVLPGVELGVKEGGGGTRTLIVFNPDGWVGNEQNDDRIKRFIDGQFVGIPNEGSRTKDDLCGCLEALDSFGHDYFIVFAHVQSDNGLCEELDGSNLTHVIESCGKRWKERVLGLQKVKRSDVLVTRWPASMPLPACVEGSDPMMMAEVGTSERPCYLKIGELTFESVKFALHDWRQRVSNKIEITVLKPCLHRISFKGGLLDGQIFSLSDQLTCLIGSRGSGKSSVIECLRYGLGLEPGESDLKYKNGLVSGMLANGGEVTVTGKTADGFGFEIRRPLGYEPLVRLEGKDTRLRPADILPGLLYFGQKDLGHRHPGFEDDLFSKLIGKRTVEEKSVEENRIAAVKQAVEAWRSVLRASEKEQEYSQEEERLRHQLAIYREKGVEKQLERLTTFDADKRNLADFIGHLQTLRFQLERAPDDWDEIGNDWPVLKSEVLENQAKKVIKAKPDFEVVRADHAAVLVRMDALLGSLRDTLNEVMEKERELQEEFAALQREIDAPGLNLEEFRARKSRHEQLVKLLKAAGNRKEMSAQALFQVEDTARALHDLWRERHRQEFQELTIKSEPLPPSLRLSIQFEGNRDEFRAFLKAKFAGTGFKNTSGEKIVESFSNGFTMFQRRGEINDLLGGSVDVAKFNTFLYENLGEILTADKPYQDKDKQFWVKKGPDKRRVTERTELRRLFQGGHVTYADASAVPGTSVADLDLEALRLFYDERFSGETLSKDEEEMSRQLQGIRLMVGNQLGLASVMLFGKRPSVLLPEFAIKAVWFKGNERGGTEYRDSRRFEGTLQSQYEQGMAFFNRWNGRVQEDGGGFNDSGSREIPTFVFEEIIVNALVHRDYFIADSVKLFIFDDRIEVRSPGTLPNSLTEEEALRGIGRDRNPLLLSLAYQLMNYRGSRSGLKRVKAAVPSVILTNDIEAEEVTVVLPLI